MKKFCIFCVLVLFSFFSFAQDAVETTVSNGNTETIRWEAVSNAKKYQLAIEKLTDDGRWEHYKTINTTKTYYKADLVPGDYRVSITGLNVLGRKGTASDWIQFRVISNVVPYIYKDCLKKLKEWNSPVLYISRSGRDVRSFPDYKKSIVAPEGFPANSFYIKARNIFYSDTEFYLEPVDKSIDGGKDYALYGRQRERVPLEVLKKESNKFGIYLSYDPSKLYSGYYNFVAVNPGGAKVEKSILVIAEEELSLKEVYSEIDNRYQIRTFDIIENKPFDISLDVAGVDSSTSYYLIQNNEVDYYPFDTKKIVDECYGKINSQRYLSNGNYHVELSFNCDNLETDFYNLIIATSDGRTESVLLHGIKDFVTPENRKESIKKVSSKYQKKTKKVLVTIKGEELNPDYKYTLISQYDNQKKSNTKIPLTVQRKGMSSLTATVAPDLLDFVVYALQVDTPEGTFVYTVELDNHFKFSAKNMKDEVFNRTFYRPEVTENADALLLNDAAENKVYEVSNNIRVKTMVPVFAPYTRFNFALDTSSNVKDINYFDLKLGFDMLNFGWISFIPGVYVSIANNKLLEDTFVDYAATLDMRLMVPGVYFSPYVGAGVGYKLVNYGQFIGFNNILNPSYLKQCDLFANVSAGVTLFSFLDMSYSLELHNLLSDGNYYFRDRMNLGIRIPIRQNYYKMEIAGQTYKFMNQEVVNGSDYEFDSDKYVILSFSDGVEEVGGFTGIKSLTEVGLYNTVLKIYDDGFANCPNLKSFVISRYSDFESIGARAFMNDKSISRITIPSSVIYIGKDAFAGWTKKQKIILNWSSNNKIERNLEGLKNTKAVVEYMDGTPFDFNTLNQTGGQNNEKK